MTLVVSSLAGLAWAIYAPSTYVLGRLIIAAEAAGYEIIVSWVIRLMKMG